MPEFGVMDPPAKKSRISPVRVETGVDIAYGEKSWRPVQSVIDLVQNHLDASEGVYERNLLETVGVNLVEVPEDELVEINSILIAAQNIDSYDAWIRINEFSNYLSSKGINLNPIEIAKRFKGVERKLPKIKLKLRKGDQSKLLDYSAVNDEADSWEITGFRIEDQGSGFDYRFLGIMGGTTKKESGGRRGGLGEGLKMSITHLVRAGADIRLLSRNEEELWLARPSGENGSIVFEGKARVENQPSTTGSITDIDFSASDFDSKLRKTIAEALDPRKDEGLGKYILDYKDPKFIPKVHQTFSLESDGVPGGRVYIKGLLVEETDEILWSYNIGEKWAINGRDRKTVNRADLSAAIQRNLDVLDDQESMIELMRAIKTGKEFIEIAHLDFLDNTFEQEAKWRQAIERVFYFSPGKDLFVASGTLDQSQIRKAQDQGYRVIVISNAKFSIHFIRDLYPDLIVTLDDMLKSKVELSQMAINNGEFVEREQVEVLLQLTKHFSEELRKAGFTTRNHPKMGALNNIEDPHAYFDAMMESPYNLERLENLRFVYQKHDSSPDDDSSIGYQFETNAIQLRKRFSEFTYSDVSDLYIQLVKAYVGTNDFDVRTQEIMTRLAADSLAELRPELLTSLGILIPEAAQFPERDYYTALEVEQDDKLLEFYQKLRRLNKLDITKEEVEQILKDWQKDTENLVGGNTKDMVIGRISPWTGINSRFYFGGKIYQIGLDGELVELPLNSNHERGVVNRILDAGASHKITSDAGYYLPFSLKKDEIIKITLHQGEKETLIELKRRGNQLLAFKTYNGKREIIDIAETQREFELSDSSIFALYNNFLHLVPGQDQTINIERIASERVQVKPEVNQGKDFLTTTISVDYGEKVWSDPRRMLLDAIQNHIDASREIPQISFTVVNREGEIRKVSSEELRRMEYFWDIIGFEVSDKGQGFTTPYLTSLGSSTKDDDQIGKFGEGLKMLAGSALKQGIKMQLASRDWVATPVMHQTSARDYEKGVEKTFELLGFNMTWNSGQRVGSSTTFSAFDLEPDQAKLSEEQMWTVNEIFSKWDTAGEIWRVWAKELDPRMKNDFGQRGIGKLVLPRESQQGNVLVRVFPNMPGSIYEKGLFVPIDINMDMRFMFGYDFNESIINTRERNNYDSQVLRNYLRNYYADLTDTSVMEKILLTAVNNPEADFSEYDLISNSFITSERTKVLWRKTFYATFGPNAILSLKSRLKKLNSYYVGGIDAEVIDRDGETFKTLLAVADEAHLETHNLIHLPEGLTSLLMHEVYDSSDFSAQIDSDDVQLSPDDHMKLYRYYQGVNTLLLGVIESLDFDQDTKDYLNKTAPKIDLRAFTLTNMKPEDLHVKGESYPLNGSVVDRNNGLDISIKQSQLMNPEGLLGTLIHESAHYLTGERDYRLDFQRFLMMIASLKVMLTVAQLKQMQQKAA